MIDKEIGFDANIAHGFYWLIIKLLLLKEWG